jgi:hypothetical protein
MNAALALIAAALAAAGSSALYAQAPKGEEKKTAPAPAFDCSRAKDPKGCEARLAKMREARDKAREACKGKAGDERRDCMEKSFCAESRDPAKCESNLEERAARRREVQQACKGKKGDELKACVREHRSSHRAQDRKKAE